MDTVDLPPCHCHRGERDNVLAFCHEVRKHAVADEMGLGHRLMAELPAWSAWYVGVMDRMMTTYPAQMDNAVRTMEHTG